MNRTTRKYKIVVAGLAAVIFVSAAVNVRITQHDVKKTIATQQEDLA